jgi:type I restriction enzyme S subunit
MSWKKTKIGEFLFERKGRYKPDDKFLLNLERLEKIDFSGNFYLGNKPSKTDMILIKKGDFVISGINVSKGAMGIYRKDNDITATIHYSSYTFDEAKIDINYFEHFLQSVEFVRLLEDQVKGGIKTEIKAKHLLNLEIFLPSLEEQRQIAEKLKYSEEKQKRLQQEIENQKTYLKNLRKQILQDAIEGKLTKEWREKNPDIEPASELLKRIKKEKEKLVSEKKIKKEKTLPPIEESEILFELPKGWAWERLEKIGIINPRNLSNNDVDASFIPMPLISNKYLESPQFEIRKWGEIKSGFTHFADNDIAVAKITPCFENSKACIFKNLKNGFGSGTTELYVFRGDINLVNPEFIYSNFKSQRFLKNGEFNMRGVAGQKRVPADFVKNFIVAIPPYKEQSAIVLKLQTLMQKLDEAEKQIEKSLETSKLLTKAVLAEAFKGE